MRILVDVRHLASTQPTGVGVYTQSLLRALLNLDQTNEYVLFSTGSTQPAIPFLNTENERVSHLHIPTPNKLLNLRTLLLRHPSINWRVREPIDLIFLPNLNITTLPLDIPTVLTIHDLSWKLYPEFFSKKMQIWHKAVRAQELVSTAREIIVPSLSTKRDLEHMMGTTLEKTHVVPHGVSPEFSAHMQASDHGVRSRLKLPKQFVLFVGTIEPRKNLLALIEGIKEYRDRTHEDLHLVIAGSWGWKSHAVRRRLWKHDTQPWVHQIDYVAQKELPALYRSARALVFPSIYEGFGLPVLESMASGTPVITSTTSSLSEVGDDACIYIDPYNSRDISEALRGLLGSTSLQKHLSEKGIARASQFYWEKSAHETLAVFNHAIKTL